MTSSKRGKLASVPARKLAAGPFSALEQARRSGLLAFLRDAGVQRVEVGPDVKVTFFASSAVPLPVPVVKGKPAKSPVPDDDADEDYTPQGDPGAYGNGRVPEFVR